MLFKVSLAIHFVALPFWLVKHRLGFLGSLESVFVGTCAAHVRDVGTCAAHGSALVGLSAWKSEESLDFVVSECTGFEFWKQICAGLEFCNNKTYERLVAKCCGLSMGVC